MPTLSPKSLYAALLKEIELFTLLRDAVFAARNLDWDERSEKIVIEAIHKSWEEHKPK